MNNHPSLNQLLPHQAPMILIDALIDVGETHVHCRVTAHADNLFFDKDAQAIPGWVGIEFMAQTVAVWSGYQAWKDDKQPPIGFLLGSRRYQSELAEFRAGTVLDIHATHMMESNGMAVFSCRIEHQGQDIASAQLNAYVPSEEKLQEMINRTPK
ncbi:hotdog family protein [Enterovibrio makurazakiensis]|uniref:Hotdog family protein n=1 Tax=Enterovibrio gelatinilyticus TaxID=2899819 RepID=A0ABT5QVB2_9GAMM|nr:hotdog family protein [Enterovibrio sp. ZSDZ42]MDD1791880.1 hotdog family protein [Enterovibrio sp. ZSDZ42]